MDSTSALAGDFATAGGRVSTAPLLARYRRPMTAGAVLDETFRIYRRAWRRLSVLILVSSAIATAIAVGGMLLLVFATVAAAGPALNASFAALARAVQAGRAPTGLTFPVGPIVGLVAGILVVSLLSAVFSLAGQGGVSVLADGEMRDQRRTVWPAFRAGLNRSLVLVGAGLVYAVGLLLASVVAVAIGAVLVSMFRAWALLAFPISLLALLAWAVSEDIRRAGAGLKWLIVLAMPFGLPIYLGVRWSLWIPATVLDRVGPLHAVRRSYNLVEGHWFRVFFVWLVMLVVVAVLQAIPGAIASAIAMALGAAPGFTIDGAGQALNVANTIGSIVGGILFGALPLIASTLMYVDLRNRHEGTDLDERLAQLEATP